MNGIGVILFFAGLCLSGYCMFHFLGWWGVGVLMGLVIIWIGAKITPMTP